MSRVFLSLLHADFWCYFIYSAVDQFRKQFAHLEENVGKSGPVIPPERKHVSLPRLDTLVLQILLVHENIQHPLLVDNKGSINEFFFTNALCQ